MRGVWIADGSHRLIGSWGGVFGPFVIIGCWGGVFGPLVIIRVDDEELVVVPIDELGICAPPSIFGLSFEPHAQLFERLVS